ncbi:tryptophan halogenase family protein [Cellvibrio sp. pealriver]|uniref:tryptophan halogenase family protein n=1 Tax=Cellvibrio sp. pealriver TaxID=1622269 RepID=UPI000A719CCE|nr:tryptophan halogenase family protein [Cellvibrio sp. pealriver]
MNNYVEQIIIVGGGTAGWLSAGLLAAEFKKNNSPIKVALIESPDVSTIGVGEGTWPSMRVTLRTIGISETDLVRECFASFKQGSKFVGWRTGAPNDFYYHPFSMPVGNSLRDSVAMWKTFFPHKRYDEITNIQSRICEEGLAPKQLSTPEYAGVLNYGYHLDAGKFAELLKSHCINNLGVTYIRDHVIAINSSDNGDVASLNTQHHGAISGDLFIDCSGTHCLLIGEHFNIPFIDARAYSMNDRALAVQVPYATADAPVASATIATAHTTGWTWDIGLSSRRGIGYVYSSSHASDEQAGDSLVAYLRQTIDESAIRSLNFRTLSIKPGYREKFWHRNCVAVGMAAGFIEPLEASALALVELSVSMIRDELPQSAVAMDIVARRFNQVFTYRWQRIIEFLKLHYVLSERRDSEYWQDAVNPAAIPDGLKELLELWRRRIPYERDLLHTEEIFPAASYLYVLYGMGFSTELSTKGSALSELEKSKLLFDDDYKKFDRYAVAVTSTRKLLSSIMQSGLKKSN